MKDYDPDKLALEKGLPANLEAEQVVLGSVLLANDVWPQVASGLQESDFTIEKHRRIYARMADLAGRGEPIEYVTLVTELEKHGQLASVEGVAYVASLTDLLPRFDSIAAYVAIVKDCASKRELIFTARSIIGEAIEGTQTADELLATAEASVMRVGDSRITAGLTSPRQAIEDSAGGVSGFLDPARRVDGLKTPWHRFDEMTRGLHPGELVILAARPGMGKTALALNLAFHLAAVDQERAGKPVAFFSLEMSKESLLQRLVCCEGRVDQHRFRGGFLNTQERRQLSAATTSVVNSRLWIDDSAHATVMDIAAKSRRLRSEHGLALVVVDYLQLMAHPGKPENRQQEISAISRALKLLAKDLDVPVVALSQLSRACETRTGDKRPILSDLRDSGAIEQDADLVAMLFREEVYKRDREDLHGLAELIISKQRNGPVGKIKLAFLNKFTRFDNLAEDIGLADAERLPYRDDEPAEQTEVPF